MKKVLGTMIIFSVVMVFLAGTGQADVVLVEPGHTMTKLVDSAFPSHPSQIDLDFACEFEPNSYDIESIAVDESTGRLWVQLEFPAGSFQSTSTCIFEVTGGIVTLVNSNTGFGINSRGTDMHFDPATGLLITQDQNTAPLKRISTQVPAFLGPTGTHCFVPPPIFDGHGTFGGDFSAGIGGSDVPLSDIVFTTDRLGNGIHSCTFGGVGTTHALGGPSLQLGDDMVIQPDGDCIHIGDFRRPITRFLPSAGHAGFPSALNIQTIFTDAGRPIGPGSRATVCDITGDIYVSYSGAPGGSAIFRIDEGLTTATHVVDIIDDQGLHDLTLGPSSSGVGKSVYFTVHNVFTQGEEVWEVTVPECNAIEVDKVYGFTDVCFEKDNDMDGEFTEDPVDFDPAGNAIDNDEDGLFNEDDTECPTGTSLGTILPTTDQPDGVERFMVNAVLKKNGKVSSYNPGQYYAVSIIDVLSDINELTIWEDYGDCTDSNLSALNPPSGGGSVVIVMVGPDGVARQIMDANSPNVTVQNDGTAHAHIMNPIPAGTTVLMYVKFKPGLKGMTMPSFPDNTCLNENSAVAGDPDNPVDSGSATADLMVRP
jgi:hypothetical protein